MSDCPPDPSIRVTLLPRDTNSHGSIFGGVILSHIDLAGAIEAQKVNPDRQFVTVAMDEVIFHQPVYVGDVVSFYTRLERVGRTSVKVHVDVRARRRRSREEVPVTEADLVFVAVDENRRPVPVLDTDAPPA